MHRSLRCLSYRMTYSIFAYLLTTSIVMPLMLDENLIKKDCTISMARQCLDRLENKILHLL